MKSSLIIATAALAAVTAATSTIQADDIVTSSFSMAQWVEDLIADPDHALSPEAALDAFNSSISATSSEELEKRQTLQHCNSVSSRRASAADAVFCINFLAGKNKQCPLRNDNNSGSAWALCTWYDAQIVTVRPNSDAWESIWCNDVARAAGLIMDRCTRGDGTVAGQSYPPQHPAPQISVNIQRPSVEQIWQG